MNTSWFVIPDTVSSGRFGTAQTPDEEDAAVFIAGNNMSKCFQNEWRKVNMSDILTTDALDDDTKVGSKLNSNVVLVILVILAILFLVGTVANTTLLLAFFRRPTLRTTSNRFILNLLIVNVFSTCLLLPLVSLDVASMPSPSLPSLSTQVQCIISSTVSSWVASLSLLSTLLISCDQYMAVLHALRYHHHITRTRATAAILGVWLTATVSAIISAADSESGSLWVSCSRLPESEGTRTVRPTVVFPILSFLLMFLLPTILLTIIYVKIYTEAHNSSERTRRCSLSPLDNLYSLAAVANNTAMAPLLSQHEQIKLSTHPSTSQRETSTQPPTIPSGREKKMPILRRSTTFDNNETGEPFLQKQKISKLSGSPNQIRRKNNLIHLKHRISNASQFMYREEGRTAKLYIFIIFLVLICWLPFYCTTILVSFVNLPKFSSSAVFTLAFIFPVVSPYVFAYRNSKIKRELHRIFHINSSNSDLSHLPPLPHPPSRLYRSVSMKEPNRERKKELRELRRSFMLQLSPKEEGNLDETVTACETPILTVTSSTETSTRSSFDSSCGQYQSCICSQPRIRCRGLIFI